MIAASFNLRGTWRAGRRTLKAACLREPIPGRCCFVRPNAYGRLGPDGPRSSRVAIDEAADTVMWHIRAGEWDGRLTPAVTELQRAVQEAEAQAALRQAG